MPGRGDHRRGLPLLAVVVGLAAGGPLPAAETVLDPEQRTAVKSAIDVGLKHLRFQQAPDGSWGDSVAATGLVVRALAESHRAYQEADGPFMRNALAYLAAAARADGSLGEAPPIESTAVGLSALRTSGNPAYAAAARSAELYLRGTLRATDPSGAPWPCRTVILAADALGPEPGARDALARLATRCQGDRDLAASVLGGTGDPGAAYERVAGALDPPLTSAEIYLLARALAAGDRSDWQGELASWLCRRQQFEGFWPATESESRFVASAFAILTLELLYGE